MKEKKTKKRKLSISINSETSLKKGSNTGKAITVTINTLFNYIFQFTLHNKYSNTWLIKDYHIDRPKNSR
ncbi:hypothetical protein GCM10027454_02530 [Algoriphagus aestuariicola]